MCLLRPQACQLPLFSYIVERLCACCYEQAWYAKLGGVVSIKFLMERLPLIWVLQNQLTFLKALLFVMMDLTGEVWGKWHVNDWRDLILYVTMLFLITNYLFLKKTQKRYPTVQ